MSESAAEQKGSVVYEAVAATGEKSVIPVPDPGAPPPDLGCWDLVAAVLRSARRALLYGPPATGKTHIASYIGGDKPTYSVTLTEDMPEAELRGHYIPKGNEFVWQDGPAIRAWREGANLVLNEINRASPEVLSFLFVLLDDPKTAILTLPTGETVRPHSEFRVFGTMNGEPGMLPEPLQDRFPVQIHVDKTNPAVLELFPKEMRKLVKRTMDLSGERRITVRQWLAFWELLCRGAEVDAAGPSVFRDKWEGLRESILLALAPAGNK